MKTIIARFTELKENVSETESEFDDLNYNDVDTALKSVGINIKDATGQFRDLDDVFLELSSKWDTLDRNTLRYIATTAAGSRQQSRFIAMMENYDRTLELIDTAQNSAGKSEEQFSKYTDTLEYKINKLKTTWELFRVNLLNSKAFKGAIDLFLKLLSKVTELNGVKLAITGILDFPLLKRTISSTVNAFLKGFESIKKSVGTVGQAISQSFSKGQQIQSFLNEIDIAQQKIVAYKNNLVLLGENTTDEEIQNLNDKISEQEAIVSQNTLEIEKAQKGYSILKGSISALAGPMQTFATMMISGADVVDAVKVATVLLAANVLPLLLSSVISYIAAKAAETIATSANTAAISAETVAKLANTTATLGLAAATAFFVTVIAAAVAGFALGIAAIVKYDKGIKEAEDVTTLLANAQEDLEETQSNLSEANENYKNSIDEEQTLTDLIETYEKYNGRLDLTEELKEDLNEATSTLISDYPEILSYYDEENNKLEISNALLLAKIDLLNEELDAYNSDVFRNLTQEIIEEDKVSSLSGMEAFENITGAELNANEYSNFYNEDGSVNWEWTKNNGNIPEVKETSEKADSQSEGTYIETVYNDTFLDALEEYSEGKIFEGSADFSYEKAQKALEALSADTEEEFLNAISDLGSAWLIALLKMREEIESFANDSIKSYSEVYDELSTEYSELELFDSDTENKIAAAIGALGESNFIADNEAYVTTETEIAESEAGEYIQDFLNSTGISADHNADYYGTAINDLVQGAYEMKNNYNALELDTKDVLEELGVTADNYEEFREKYQANDNRTTASMIKLVEETIISQGVLNLDETYQEAFKSAEGQNLISSMSEFMTKDMGEMTRTGLNTAIENYSDRIRQLLGLDDDANVDEILLTLNLDEESLNESYNTFEDYFGEKAPESMKKNIVDAYNNAVSTVTEGTGSTAIAENFVGDLKDSLSGMGLNDTLLSEVLSIDWSSYNLAEDTLDDFVRKQLESTDLTDEQKEKFSEVVLQIGLADGAMDNVVDSELELKSLVDDINSSYKELYDDSGDYVDAITEQMNDGQVSLSTYLNMVEHITEMGGKASDYFNIDENGKITTSEEKIKQLYIDLVKALKDRLKELKASLLTEMAQEKIQISEYRSAAEALRGSGQLNDLTWDTVEGNSVLAQSWNNIADTIITILNSLGDTTYTTADIMKWDMSDYQSKFSLMTQEERDELADVYDSAADSMEDSYEIQENALESIDDLIANVDDTARAYVAQFYTDIQDGLDDTSDDVEDLTDEINDLKEAIQGSDDWSTDSLENLNAIIKTLEENATRAKEALDDLTPDDNVLEIWENYTNTLSEEMAGYEAYAEVSVDKANAYKDLLESLGDRLLELNEKYKSSGYSMDTNVGDMYSIDSNTGKMMVNYENLYNALMPDDIRDLIKELAQGYNEELDNYNEYIDKKKDLEDEFKQYLEDALNDIITLEDDVKEVLKERYQDEIDDLQDKYDKMEEADNDYYDALKDAIDKQRELRELEDSWKDLAEKEKKYSLMARDTSGSNQAEVQSLGQEIEDDRQDLLDSTVDNILELLKEKFDLEAEEHEEEIEYQLTLIDEEALTSLAVALISTWNSPDDALAFFMGSSEYQEASVAEQESLINKWNDEYTRYASAQEIRATTLNSIEDLAGIAVLEIKDVTMPQVATDVATTVDTTILEVGDNIESAQDALEKAIDEAASTVAGAIGDLGDNGDEDSKAEEKNEKTEMAYVVTYTKDGERLTEYYHTEENAAKRVEDLAKLRINATYEKKYNIASKYTGTTKASSAEEANKIAADYGLRGYTGISIGSDNSVTYTRDGVQYEDSYLDKATTQSRDFIGPIDQSFTEEWYETILAKYTAPDDSKPYRYLIGKNSSLSKELKTILGINSSNAEDVCLYFSTEDEMNDILEKVLEKNGTNFSNKHYEKLISGSWSSKWNKHIESDSSGQNDYTLKFKTGGLVDYTGPAWVDGTKSQPEAFLSSEDTQRIGEAAKLLSNLPILSSDVNSSNITQTQGDTSFEININIESISDDYDVEDMIEKMKTEIVNASNEIGTNVILKK